MASDSLAARAGASRPPVPVPIAVLSAAVGIAAVLPLLYLVLRALSAGTEIWMGLLTPRMGEIMGRSLLLVVAVAAVAVLLGLPLAWLTTRTDLPFRQAWLVLATLPLVVPTYVGGLVLVLALGPKGQLQRLLEPLGVERLPEIYGFPGALLVLGLHTYPYVLLNARAALLRLDPSVEEGLLQPRPRALGDLPSCRPAPAPAGGRC